MKLKEKFVIACLGKYRCFPLSLPEQKKMIIFNKFPPVHAQAYVMMGIRSYKYRKSYGWFEFVALKTRNLL